MNQQQLIDDDYEAAREYLRKIGQGVEDEAGVHALAIEHAQTADLVFRLKYGLREPRCLEERIVRAALQGQISRADCEAQMHAAESRSIDVEMVDGRFDALADRLRFLYRALQVIVGIAHGMRSMTGVTNRAIVIDRYLREANTSFVFGPKQTERILKFLAECRIESRIPQPHLHKLSANTAFELAREVISYTCHFWTGVCEAVGQRDTNRSRAAALFLKECFGSIPSEKTVRALLAEEAAAARLIFRKQLQGQHPQEIKVDVKNEVNLAPAPVFVFNQISGTADGQPQGKANAGRPVQESGRQHKESRDAAPAHGPRLKNWAVGIETGNVWWLFHALQGRWDSRCKISIPGGNPHKLLVQLANKSGVLTLSEAQQCLAPEYVSMPLDEFRNVVTYALAKLRPAIRKAIAAAARSELAQVPDPIPNLRPGWRAEIEIGFAVMEENRLTFRRREELEA